MCRVILAGGGDTPTRIVDDMPARFLNVDYKYTKFQSYLPPISMTISSKNHNFAPLPPKKKVKIKIGESVAIITTISRLYSYIDFI